VTGVLHDDQGLLFADLDPVEVAQDEALGAGR
jgi:hypothetical protein